uniref:Uncharacterized protein n=1 Tax=Tanacetum cinerariifolium TaxID=118510 RepID=A0A699HLM8_TANCI|nr:hypothetical protein [Tanacetum cinerariifolium]
MKVSPNGDALRKCILSGPYKPTTVLVQAVAATDDSPAILKHTTVETPMNMSPENKAPQEIWEAIKRLQQGESLNIQDVKTNLFWEFEWSRFVTIVKQQHKPDEVSYHKLFDILKQYQKEVNELRTERLARNANPLALVAAAQANQDLYYQTSKSHKSYAPSSKPSIPTRSHTTTRHKGKEIAKPITPLSKIVFEEDNDPEQAQRDKDMHKNLALIAKTMNVAGAKENVRSPIVQQSGIQSKQGVPLQAEQYDWLADTDKEIDEHELEAHYSYMAKIQEVPTANTCIDSDPLEQIQNEAGYNVFANDLQHSEQSEFVSNTCLVEMDDSNVIPYSPDMYEDAIQNDQNDVESDDERVALANLIAILKLDVDENKKIQKLLKKANTTLAQELKESKTILAETSKTLGECNSVWDSCLVALQNKQTAFEKYKAFNDHIVDYDKLELKLNEALGQLAQKYIEIKEVKECDCLAQKLSNQTDSVSKEVHSELLKRFAKVEKHSISLEIALQKCKEQNIAISEMKKLIERGKGKFVETKFDKPSVVRQPNAQRIPKPSVLGKPTPFSNSLERRYFPKIKSVPKTNVSEGLSKPVTAQTLPQTAMQARSRDVLTVGSTMRIPILYRGEYSQWVKRFMNYLEEQIDGEAMINSIKNGDQPLPHVTQVSIARTSSTEQPPLKDKSMWSDQEKRIQKIDRKLQFCMSMKLSKLLKENCCLTLTFEWKQYATMMRQNKNLMDINIDALYSILKQNQGDVTDAMGSKKKSVVVTSDPLALIAEKTNVVEVKRKLLFLQILKEVKPIILEGYFAKDCKKVKVKDYAYYKTKMLLAKKDKDKQVLLAEDQAWMESSSDSDQEINANMVFMAEIEKVLSDSKASSSSADEKIFEKHIEKANQQSKHFENQNKDLQDKYDVLKNQATTFEMNNKELNEQLKDLIEKNNDLLAQTKALKDQL